MNIYSFLLQVTTEISPPVGLNYAEVFNNGGFISYILLGLSIVLAILFLNRLWVFYRLSGGEKPNDLLDRIKQLIMARGVESAQENLRKSSSSYAIILRESLEIRTYITDPKQLKERIDEVAQRELTRLERSIGYISLIAGAAPMIGFLGTVIGMMKAFKQLANKGVESANPQALATGIEQAMATTMGGLLVGLLAYITYNVFIAWIHKITDKMNVLIHDFILMWQQRS